MFTTNKYKEVKKGEYKYVFYLNNRDVFESKRDFVIELNILIERFSRELEDKGLIVKTYDADIEKVRQDILDKPWNPLKLKTINKTPGMLMIDTDFEEFNPNKHNWLYFYFIRDQRYKRNIGNSYTIEEAEELFNKLAEIITKTDCNVYKEVKKMRIKEKAKRIGTVVMEEVVSYGTGISADKFLEVINKIWKDKFNSKNG